jgi:hypothetical protein
MAVGPSGRPQRGPHAPDRPPDDRPTPAPASVAQGATPDSAGAAANLSLTLHVDLTAREATVALDDGADAIKLVFDGTAWRPAAS